MKPTAFFARVMWAVNSRVVTAGEQKTTTGRAADFIQDKLVAISRILDGTEHPLKVHSELFFI